MTAQEKLHEWARVKYGTENVPDGAKVRFDFEQEPGYSCCGANGSSYIEVHVGRRTMPGSVSVYDLDGLIAEILEAT